MKLQVALDTLNLTQAIQLVEKIQNEIDIVEIGTPFIIREGVKAVTEMKNKFPNLEILADLKIMDAGKYEADIAFEAGADIVTVMAVTNESTIVSAIEAAHARNKKCMIDMMNCPDLVSYSKHYEQLGADYLCVHTAFDEQANHDPINDLHTICNSIAPEKAAVAGGISLKTIDAVANEKPGVIIAGGSICNAADPVAIAKALKQAMEG